MGALELRPAGKTGGRQITLLYPSVKVDIATHVLEQATTRYGAHVWPGRNASILPLPQNRGRNRASGGRAARIRDKADGGLEVRCLPGVCAQHHADVCTRAYGARAKRRSNHTDDKETTPWVVPT